MRFIFILSSLMTAALAAAQTTQPATQPSPQITPAAQSVLNDLKSSYANVKSLQLAGSVSLDFEAGSQTQKQDDQFTSTFDAQSGPPKFRHEMKNDLLIVSDASKAWVYKPDSKRYIPQDAPQQRGDVNELPDLLTSLLIQQNPSLLMALTKDAAATLTQDAETVDRGNDLKVDGNSYAVINMKAKSRQITLLVDPKSHLLKRVSIDLKQHMTEQGVPDVKTAMLVIDYLQTSTDKPAAAEMFAWAPPADAMQVQLSSEGLDATGDEPAMALEGTAAPNFTLKDLNGQPVTLAKFRGNVVVLDFWATWCGPCRMSLPHLDDLNKNMAGQGVKVFAVDQAEEKAIVQQFITDQKFGFTVLLDDSGAVGQQYKVTGIPQTVIIGKNGKIEKVFIGFGPGMETQLQAAVDAAMHK